MAAASPDLKGRRSVSLEVVNTGDRPIQVGSHYHFFETNAALKFERKKAYGCRLSRSQGAPQRIARGGQYWRQADTGGLALSLLRDQRSAQIRAQESLWLPPQHRGGNGGALRAGPDADGGAGSSCGRQEGLWFYRQGDGETQMKIGRQ